MKAEKHWKWSMVRILLVFLLFPLAPLFAGEVESKNVSREISNIGFMEKPPKDLQEKFPMCDAFLKVKWIDKDKKIGYTHYEALLINGKGALGKERKKVWALVNLDDTRPSYTLDIYQYKRQGRMNNLFELVKKGQPARASSNLQIKYKGAITAFYDQIGPVLSDHRQTVCVVYPDGNRAWIIEGKNVKHAYSEAQQEILFNRINETGQSVSHQLLEKLWILLRIT